MQIALRPKVSWGISGIAGTVQIHCTDLCSSSGDRLGLCPPLTLHSVDASSYSIVCVLVGRYITCLQLWQADCWTIFNFAACGSYLRCA